MADEDDCMCDCVFVGKISPWRETDIKVYYFLV